MGVLACDRNGCDNIMCDFTSYERGEYLCEECRQELINKGPCNIDEFMGCEKHLNNNLDWEDYINSLFKSRFEEK